MTDVKDAGTSQQQLLSEFAPPTQDQWMGLIEKQLKGAPFEKKLVTKTPEEIALQPIYLRNDVEELTNNSAEPGSFPFTRGVKASGNRIEDNIVGQEYKFPTAKEFNEAAQKDTKRGLTALSIILDQAGQAGLDADAAGDDTVGKQGLSILGQDDLKEALQGVDLSKLFLQVTAGSSAVSLIGLLNAQDIDLKALKGNLLFDPLAKLAKEGKQDRALSALYNEMAELVQWSNQEAPQFRTVCIDVRPYHESGASAVQELAFAMATATTYIQEMIDRGVAVDAIAQAISFQFSIGPNFFMEIAKLRTARTLWANVVKAFGGNEDSQKMSLHGSTASWNKTVTDPYVNMLRTTTEGFSGVVAGCESLYIAPFDDIYSLSDEFSRRIARNVQIVIQEETHVNKVVDPAGGAWYVENLTEELGQKAWALFQEVEKAGGMTAALKEGSAQEAIEVVATKKRQALGSRKEVLVGTNMFANIEEDAPVVRLPDYAALKTERTAAKETLVQGRGDVSAQLKEVAEAGKGELIAKATAAAKAGATLGEIAQALPEGEEQVTVTPLNIRRGSEDYEELRAAADRYKEKNGDFPKIFLANMGPISQYKLRADFCSDFLRPGGFSVINNPGNETVQAAADATIESGASVVVMCSTDPTYPELIPPFVEAVRAKNPSITVVVAGYPKNDVEALKAAGVDEFIHVRANNLELLKQFQTKTGVN